MPDVSRFYGILIKMNYGRPRPPHIHAVYSVHEAFIDLEALDVIRGDLPPRATALVLEWAALHRAALLENFALTEAGKPPLPIEPLE